jgi:hypothetical protein
MFFSVNPENQVKDPVLDIVENREIFYNSGRRPEHISVCKNHQLQYKVKNETYKHDKSMNLPYVPFSMNLELIKMNEIIVNRFGKEYEILQTDYFQR